MTLRDLLKISRYKDVFNIVHQEYYKDHKLDDIYHADSSYRKVFKELLTLPHHPNEEYKIYIRESHNDWESGPVGEKFIDVCLYCEEDDETYAMDLTPWGELVDAEVKYGIPLSGTKAVAHVLWELTFYGFTEQDTQLEKDKLEKTLDRIEKGEEKLIPWGDVMKELESGDEGE